MCHALWACSHAESLDDPGLRLDRPDLPGEELRTTNFGGGSISAKVKHKDPLPGDQVQVRLQLDKMNFDVSTAILRFLDRETMGFQCFIERRELPAHFMILPRGDLHQPLHPEYLFLQQVDHGVQLHVVVQQARTRRGGRQRNS